MRKTAASAGAKGTCVPFLLCIAFVAAFPVRNNALSAGRHLDKCIIPLRSERKTSTVFSDIPRRKPRSTFLRVGQTKKSASTLQGSFEEGDVGISRDNGATDTKSFFSLYYLIYNPSKALKDPDSGSSQPKPSTRPPLVVLHGGPSLPSQYLYPLVEQLESNRPIIFYDQLGCGKSDEPKEKDFYSIEQSVHDLEIVLETLCGAHQKVHLLGHSYGGCLAFEFAKHRPDRLASLILSSAPTNMKMAGDSYDRLASRNPFGFWKQHVCSVSSSALDDALQHVGNVWSGLDVVLDYIAIPPTPSSPSSESLLPTPSSSQVPQTLAISGANDFAFESSQGWKDIIGDALLEKVCLDDCAHYPHLEDGATFGRLLDGFMSKNDR